MKINNPLFNGLPDNEYHNIISQFKKVKYRKNECIFSQQDRIEDIYLILDGLVEISQYTLDGTKNIVNLLTHDEMFAESFALSNDPIAPYYSTCLKDTILLRIKTDTFNKLSHTYPTLMFNMVNILATKNTFLSFKIDCLSKNNIKDKVFELLRYYHIKQNSYQIKLPFNKTQLAEFLGVNRSALSREMKKMINAKIFSYMDKQYLLNEELFNQPQ